MMLKNTIYNVVGGRVHFPKENLGKILKMGDGQEFTMFRHLAVDSKDDGARPAVFKVRFKFKRLPSGINKVFSMFPIPFLIGLPGFREKCWTMNEGTGQFQGMYQWASEESAKKYPDSFIFRLMTKRAVPGSVSHEIITDTRLSDYIHNMEDQE